MLGRPLPAIIACNCLGSIDFRLYKTREHQVLYSDRVDRTAAYLLEHLDLLQIHLVYALVQSLTRFLAFSDPSDADQEWLGVEFVVGGDGGAFAGLVNDVSAAF